MATKDVALSSGRFEKTFFTDPLEPSPLKNLAEKSKHFSL